MPETVRNVNWRAEISQIIGDLRLPIADLIFDLWSLAFGLGFYAPGVTSWRVFVSDKDQKPKAKDQIGNWQS